jgi:hypothetical protein
VSGGLELGDLLVVRGEAVAALAETDSFPAVHVGGAAGVVAPPLAVDIGNLTIDLL